MAKRNSTGAGKARTRTRHNVAQPAHVDLGALRVEASRIADEAFRQSFNNVVAAAANTDPSKPALDVDLPTIVEIWLHAMRKQMAVRQAIWAGRS